MKKVPLSAAPPDTVLPTALLSRPEQPSGLHLNAVGIHRDSGELAPISHGSGVQSTNNETRLPQGGWHVVPAAEGRVQPTVDHASGATIDVGEMLEPEADAMGVRASAGVGLRRIHHVAIICSDYAVSKRFYTETLALQVIAEHYREARQSHKLDLALPDGTQIELFSFPNPPSRSSRPEACGLRHLAFGVDDIEQSMRELEARGVSIEPFRVDEYTGRRFTFFADPDGLPIELYDVGASSS